jgi:calcineurin-like phosphoesterase family protein
VGCRGRSNFSSISHRKRLMMDTWIISDTHFGHDSILIFKDYQGKPLRLFENAKEMDEYIISKWNSVVKPEDKVYHLGDVMMRATVEKMKLISRLNGKKTLILGNHDSPEMYLYRGHFGHIYSFRSVGNLLLTHVPILRLPKWAKANVHGHVHNNIVPGEYGPQYYNVSIEVLDDYAPIHLDELNRRIDLQLGEI